MKRILQGLVGLAGTALALGQGTIVVPNHLANVEGNSSAGDVLSAPSFRLQMVFDASQFAGLSTAADVTNYLTGISFRIDGAALQGALTSFGGGSISVSTTSRGVDSLSPVFAENLGSDRTVVWSNPLAMGTIYQPGFDPQPFTGAVPFSTPFRYSPSMGNLLVDIRGRSPTILFPGALDAENTLGDSISRVFSSSEISAAGTADTLGLVTRFSFIAVPEPSTWALLVMGSLVGLTLLRRK